MRDKEKKDIYMKGYYAGYRRATINHLGNKCVVCGTTENIEIAHKKELMRKSRSLKDWENLEELELKCTHDHDKSWVKIKDCHNDCTICDDDVCIITKEFR